MHVRNLSAGAIVLSLEDAFAEGVTEIQCRPESAFNSTISR